MPWIAAFVELVTICELYLDLPARSFVILVVRIRILVIFAVCIATLLRHATPCSLVVLYELSHWAMTLRFGSPIRIICSILCVSSLVIDTPDNKRTVELD